MTAHSGFYILQRARLYLERRLHRADFHSDIAGYQADSDACGILEVLSMLVVRLERSARWGRTL